MARVAETTRAGLLVIAAAVTPDVLRELEADVLTVWSREQADRVERGVYQMSTLLEPVFLTYDERAALRAQPAPGSQAADRPGPESGGASPRT